MKGPEPSRTQRNVLHVLVSLLYTVTLCLVGGKASHVECVSPTVNLSYVNQIVLLEAHSWDQPWVRKRIITLVFALFFYGGADFLFHVGFVDRLPRSSPPSSTVALPLNARCLLLILVWPSGVWLYDLYSWYHPTLIAGPWIELKPRLRVRVGIRVRVRVLLNQHIFYLRKTNLLLCHHDVIYTLCC